MEDKIQGHTTDTGKQGFLSDISMLSEIGFAKSMVPKTKLVISMESNCFRNKFSQFNKTTLNNIFGTNFNDLFFELEIFCHVTESLLNRITSIEDIKYSLYEHLDNYSELISSITIDNLPSIIMLYLNNLESLYFQMSNMGIIYYMLL
jgi:hypothetical protein